MRRIPLVFGRRRRRLPCRALPTNRRAVASAKLLCLEPLEDRRLLAVVSWDGGAGTLNWHDPANWSGDELPIADDDVVINAGHDVNITHVVGITHIRSLQGNSPLILAGDTLDVATTVQLDNTLTINGGTLANAIVLAGPGNDTSLLVTSNGNNRLDGVTVEGDLTLAANSALLRIANGLTLDGTIHMDGNGATLGFEGSQTLSGSGTIQFGTSGSGNRYLEMASDGTLTIDAGITLRGGKANVGGSSRWGRSMSLINQGAILADVPGQTLRIQASRGSFVNQGLLRAAEAHSTWTS